ncbi:MAG: hypothetical protein Q8R28_11230 [Dehalococcoidia bacterium]|nr:hypothetical protein [Dehalococcoidia bacterium]
MNSQQLDATIEFGVEQAKKRILANAADYPPADLQIVLLVQIRDALIERSTWRKRAVTAIPWAGFGTGIGSLVAVLLKVLGQ